MNALSYECHRYFHNPEYDTAKQPSDIQTVRHTEEIVESCARYAVLIVYLGKCEIIVHVNRRQHSLVIW